MYSKLFASILDSSVWLEPTPTRIVWLTLLAAKDQDGFARFASIDNLARRAVVSIAEAEAAVSRLESPDANSSNPDHEGRRIERMPGGWVVLNAKLYDEMVRRADELRLNRERVKRHRAKKDVIKPPPIPALVVDDLPMVPADPEMTAVYLAVCLNHAVAQRWGEQPSPMTHGQAEALRSDLVGRGVPIDVARLSIYRQCENAKTDRPPKHPNYFAPGIVSDWDVEQARRALAASGAVAPPKSQKVTRSFREADELRNDEEGQRRLIRDRSGNVDQRRLALDGPEWWGRIVYEARQAGINPVLYGFDRMHESASGSA